MANQNPESLSCVETNMVHLVNIQIYKYYYIILDPTIIIEGVSWKSSGVNIVHQVKCVQTKYELSYIYSL